MRRSVIAALALLALFTQPSAALAQSSAPVVESGGCGNASFPSGTGYFTLDSTGRNCVNAFLPSGAGPILTQPSTVTTTTNNSTITVTNTFQAALAAATARKSCLLQNTGTHTEYVYFGAIGSATTSNAFQISPGQTISCATTNGLVLTDAVNITGTSGDGYVVTNQ